MLDTSTVRIGIAKQTAQGSAAAAPVFAHGLASGGLSVAPNQEPDALTSEHSSPAGAHRDKVENGAAYETRAFVKSIGLYLLAALGNDVVTGTGPYTHVITLAGDLPYLTVFEEHGDGTIMAVRDNKVDEISLEWEENKPLVVSAKVAGTVLSFPATFVPTTDETDSADYFTPVGGTFKASEITDTPVTAAVLGGKITIKRGAAGRFRSGSIEAGDVAHNACDVDVSLTLDPDDLSAWRKLITGAVDGSGVSEDVQYGSFEVTFVHGSDSLELAGSHVAFLCELPEADPAGEPVDLELAGKAFRGSGTTPVTATVINAQATY